MDNKNNEYFNFDEKAVATIKASTIWNAVSAVIISISGMATRYYFASGVYSNMMGPYSRYLDGYLDRSLAPRLINIPMLVNDLVWGAICGAIIGWLIAKFYPKFVEWQKNFTNNKLNTFFKMLFWPYLVAFGLSLVLTGALSVLYSGFTLLVINILADIAAVYVYAKMMNKAVGKYYN